MQMARALMMDSSSSTAVPPGHAASDSFESDLARSDGSRGETSSGLLNPHWRRLIVAVSRSLAQRLSDAVAASESRLAQEMMELVHTDATGGGSQMDIHLCFEGALEATELVDSSTSFVLVGAYYYLQADDVVLTTQTWRPLVVTSLLAAASELRERAEREQTIGRLRRCAAHWWPEDKADRALQVFKLRDAFLRDPLSEQKIAALYSELRARSLEIAPLDDSIPGSAVFEFPRDQAPKRGEHVRVSAPRSSRNGDLADRSIQRGNASSAFSEARSRGIIDDGYTSDNSVISI
jgi:hypothetical protein